VVRIDADGLHARLLQHEIDHLDGVLMIDRATPEERKAALRRYHEAQLAGAKPGETSI
jgi:peptide deformylase